MRIAHLSDIHLNTLFKKTNIGKTKKLLKLALEKGFDHLVVTGDISDNAEEKDFIIFRKILKSFDLLDSSKTTIVIGNHDIFGGVNTALDVVNFPSKCLKVDYNKKVTEFIGYFQELFENCYFPLKDNFFPFAKIIEDTLFVGLNTIDYYSRLKNPFASNGKIYKEQFDSLKGMFMSQELKSKRKIVLSHHHYYRNTEEATSSSSFWNKIESYTLKLRGKKKIIKLFTENNVDLVLHGHSHEIRDYERKGVRFINAGGSVDNSFTENASLVIIDINEKIKAEITSVNLNPPARPKSYYERDYIPSLAG